MDQDKEGTEGGGWQDVVVPQHHGLEEGNPSSRNRNDWKVQGAQSYLNTSLPDPAREREEKFALVFFNLQEVLANASEWIFNRWNRKINLLNFIINFLEKAQENLSARL